MLYEQVAHYVKWVVYADIGTIDTVPITCSLDPIQYPAGHHDRTMNAGDDAGSFIQFMNVSRAAWCLSVQ